MSNTATKGIWQTVCQLLGINEQINLSIMHLGEIESEAENLLELLTVLRTDTYRSDKASAQETAAEVTITLEHLQHHIQEILPILQKTLDLEP